MSPPRQLTFRWPHSPSFAREDFLPAPSNLDALAAIELWPNWSSRMLMLVGPEGAGQVAEEERVVHGVRIRHHE